MNKLLLEAPVGRLYFRYLVPTLCATLVTAIYLFADTVMVGYRLGAEALAALNLIIPPEFCFFAVGSMLGNGGAVCFTRRMSAGDAHGAHRCFTMAVLAGTLFALTATALTMAFFRPLAVHVLGVGNDAHLLKATTEYGIFIAASCPFTVAATLLAPFLRHDRAPRRAMAGVLSGGIANIFLDWLFMFPLDMGLSGAGLATALGTALTVAVMLPHFRRADRTLRFARPDPGVLPAVMRFGGSAFLQELSGGLTVLLFNRLALSMLGRPGLIVYGVLANWLMVMAAFFSGVAQAAQPLAAANAATHAPDRVRRTMRLALRSALILGTPVAAAALIAPELFMRAFLSAEAVASLPETAPRYLALALVCLPFMGLGQVSALLMPALGRPAAGTLFAFLRNGAVLLPLGFLLGKVFGPQTIWFAFVPAEAILLPLMFRKLRPQGDALDAGRLPDPPEATADTLRTCTPRGTPQPRGSRPDYQFD